MPGVGFMVVNNDNYENKGNFKVFSMLSGGTPGNNRRNSVKIILF